MYLVSLRHTDFSGQLEQVCAGRDQGAASDQDSQKLNKHFEGVSYVFAGKSELDLTLALDILDRELGASQRSLSARGACRGTLILCPAVDGAKGAPSAFGSTETEAEQRAPVTAMMLESSHALEGGAMLLRYRIQNAGRQASGR